MALVLYDFYPLTNGLFHMKRLCLLLPALLFSISLFAHEDDNHTHAPQAPNNINAISNNAGIVVSWDSTSAYNYRVYRNGSEVAQDLSGTTFTDANVAPGLTYKYFITSCNEHGQCSQGSSTAEVQYTGGLATGGEISCPSGSVSTSNLIPLNVVLSDNAILSWIPPVNSVKWNVYQNGAYVDTVTDGVPSYSVGNHVEGDEYYITAIFPNGDISTASEIANFTPAPTDCSAIAADNATLTADLASLQTDYDELAVIAVELETALAEALEVIRTLRLDETETQAALELANLELTGLRVAVASAEDATVEAQGLLATANEDLALCTTDLATANAAVTAAESATAASDALLVIANADLATAQADLATCQATP